jgi:hypothetical protein
MTTKKSGVATRPRYVLLYTKSSVSFVFLQKGYIFGNNSFSFHKIILMKIQTRASEKNCADVLIGLAYSLLIIFLCLSKGAVAQNNTFPTSGNAGVGTTNPGSKFEVVGSTHERETGCR